MTSEQVSTGGDGLVPSQGPAAADEPSTGELLRGLADDATTLVRQEVLLARQEMAEGLVSGARAASLLVVAGVLVLYGIGFLLASAAQSIYGPAWLGPLIVGGALVLLAGTLGLLGGRRLSRSKVTPAQARAELRETANELREEIRWVRPRRRPPERSS